MFSNETGFFDDLESRLLNELAGDLSFALKFIGNEEQLSYLAFYDVLTGLPNERLFLDRLTQFLHANKPGSLVAVIMIDLNRFSQLNDALGRHAGDDLLKQIARCLTDALKDPVSIARIGRDIFAIALPDLSHGTDAATALEQKIFAALDRQFILSEQDIRVSARAGLALYPLDGHDPEVLFKHAEAALRNAKSSGKRYAYYAPEMNAALSARLSLENELRLALETGQFMLVFQPRVDISTGCIIGAEALIRWRHPQSGMVMPSAFIPLAEEIGFIVLIDEWVAGSVCAQQAAWLKQGVEIVPISINLSAVQFKHGNVIKTITDAIETHGIECHHIEAELTESAVMEDPNEAARALNTLKDMGILLALDDFGTGYSSLAYLKRFPFDFVKIDRAFITDITTNSGDAAIATAVIAMAHSLDMRVVAEGVETGNQLAFLRGQGCDAIQGYYFSQPVPAEKFEAMLREKKQLSSVHL